MMNKLKAKLKKDGGFTLIEMLIVVAIIAILIAVSIPLINSALEKARDATDDANYRSAAALANILVLTDDCPTTSTDYYYVTADAAQGTLETNDTNAYVAKCTSATADKTKHSKTGSFKNAKIKVTIDPTKTDIDEIVTVAWE